MIILDAELRTVSKQGWKQGDQEGGYFSHAGKKYGSLDQGSGGRDREKRSGLGYILEKASTDLDNRLDMRGEGDGKVRDDPQIWGLSSCVDSGTIVWARDHWGRAGLGERCFPVGNQEKCPQREKFHSLLLLLLAALQQSSKGAHTFYIKFDHQRISPSYWFIVFSDFC